jgi:DNA-binding response OmpR family regulator
VREAIYRLEALLEAEMEGTRGSTVLVVEDEPTTLELITHILARGGYEVVVARTGQEARTLAAEREPDVVIMDLGLPDVDGRHLLMEIRRADTSRRTPVVVLSGKLGAQVKGECFAYGADAFIEKPVEATALLGAVTALVDRSHSVPRRPGPLADLPDMEKVVEVFRQAQKEAGATGLSLALLEIEPRVGNGESERGHRTRQLLGSIVTHLRRRLTPSDVLAQWNAHDLLLLAPTRSGEELVRELEALQALVSAEGGILSAGVVRAVPGSALLEAIGRADRILNARPGAVSGEASGDDGSDRPSVLVVEDDPVTATLVEHHLDRAGLRVSREENGKKALERILLERPSLVVLDLQLPGMNGLEILARLHEGGGSPGTRVVVLSALGDDENVSRAFRLGAHDYVAKPFSPGQFMARVLRLMRQ